MAVGWSMALKPNTAAESSLVSALLGWEKTQTLNIGFDLWYAGQFVLI